jgi:hypothetical protein
MGDVVRDPVRDELRQILMELPIGAVVLIRRNGNDRPARMPWPADAGGREAAWKLLEAAIYRSEKEGQVEVIPHGWGRSRRYVIPWPAGADLFAKVDPPAPAGPLPGTAENTDQVQVVRSDEPMAIEIRKPPRASRECAGHILLVIYRDQQRLTTNALANRLAEARLEWSMSTIEATASWLIQVGRLDNRRDEKGRGYGLPRWDEEPDPDAL